MAVRQVGKCLHDGRRGFPQGRKIGGKYSPRIFVTPGEGNEGEKEGFCEGAGEGGGGVVVGGGVGAGDDFEGGEDASEKVLGEEGQRGA